MEAKQISVFKQNRMRTWVKNIILLCALTSTFFMSTMVIPYNIEMLRDDGTPKVNLHDDFDHYRQFNTDINVWVNETLKFSEKVDNHFVRINRPVYLAISGLASRIGHIVDTFPDVQTGLTVKLSKNLTFHSMLWFNYFFIIVLVFLYHNGLRYYFDDSVSFIAALMLALSSTIVRRAMISSPEIMGLFITLIVVYLFDRYMVRPDKPSWRSIVAISLVIGVLFLVKAHYHVLIAILIWALCIRRWKVCLGILFLHFIPLILWMVWLNLSQIEYRNHEADAYRQVVWVFDYISAGRLLDIFPDAINYASIFFEKIILVFTPFTLILAAWTYSTPEKFPQRGRYGFIIYVAGFVLFFTLIKRSPDYMVFDLYIFLYPMVAIVLIHFKDWLNQLSRFTRNISLVPIVIGYLIIETIFSWYVIFHR